MMMTSAPSSSFHDYLTMDSIWSKADSLSPIETLEDHFEQSFDEDINCNNSNNNLSTNNNPRNSTVKRPMNAFLLWARGERKRVSSDGYGVSQTSLSKLLGETWRRMSVEEKQPFLDMAETLKKQHHLDHPDYRFKPRQRSVTANKAIAKKHHIAASQQHTSSMIASPTSSASSSQYSQQTSTSSPISNATPHPIQCSVLAMCHAMIPPSSSSISTGHDDWFAKLTEQPQSVIVVPTPRSQPSPTSTSSRRAVRIQIINKHDDIALAAPTSLPMTPSPAPCLPRLSTLPITVDESTPSLTDYLAFNNNGFFQNTDHQQDLTPAMDTSMGYETYHDSSTNQFIDLDQHCDATGWIDTPLSNFGANSTDMISSPYPSYDFLCL